MTFRGALLSCQRAAIRRRLSLLPIVAIAVALFAWRIPGTRVLLSIGDLTEPRLPSTAAARELARDFDRGHTAFVVFESKLPDGLSHAQLEAIARWIESERAADPDVIRIVSPLTLERRRVAGATLWTLPLMPRREAAELEGLRSGPWSGILTDRKARDLGVEVAFRDSPGGSRFGSFDPRTLAAFRDRMHRSTTAVEPGLVAHLAGEAAFDLAAFEGIRRFQWLNLAMIGFILVAFRVLLGTWRSGALLVGVLVVSGLTVYGAMSLAGSPIDYLSTGLFLMLAVASLEDFLFLSYEQLANGTGWAATCRRLVVPCWLTSATTVAGFASLAWSDLAIVRRFGLWAAFGAALEWAVTFLLLPAFLRAVRFRGTWTDAARAWRTSFPERLASARIPRRLALVLLGAYGIAAFAAFHLPDHDDVSKLFPRSVPYRTAVDYVRESRGWTAEISVIFPPKTPPATVAATLTRIDANANVVRTVDPYAALRYLTSGMTAPGKMRSLFSDGGSARAGVYVADVRHDALTRTLRDVESACAGSGCRAAGDVVSYAEFVGEVPRALFRSFAVCLLLVAGLMTAVFVALRVRGLPWVLAASFWGPAVLLGALWALDVPLSILTCVFASVLVGLTGDNAIQYAFASRGGAIVSGIPRRGGASVQVALVMGTACLWFLGSAFVPSRILGSLLAAGLLASLAGDLWILQGLAPPFRDSLNGRERTP